MAQKYFGNDDPMGKIFSANNKYDFVVTGVMTDIPPNSSLEFDMLIPFEFTKELGWYNERWGSNSIQTYVLVEQSSDIPAVNKKMTEIVHSHNEESTTDFLLAPLMDMHLHSYWGYGHEMGNIQYVYIFGVVARFVLLLACINFMNLSTARSANRAKEIGLRKVSGALRSSIAGQFLGESILMAFAALVFAILLVTNLLPLFNHISGKEITSAVWAQPDILIGLVVITLLTGIIAGSYPALFLSGFEPVRVLKGKLKSGAKSSALRKGLVVAQFALSVMLMIGTAVVYNQFVFMKNKNLGYDKEHVLYIRMRGDIGQSYRALKHELLEYPQVLGVSASRQQPASIGSSSSGAEWDGKDPDKEDVLISFSTVGYDYVETLKIEMVQGRSFSPEFPSDLGTDSTGAFVINEELARAQRDSANLVCLMLDIDHFKSVNDNWGHAAGDAVLIELAQRIESQVRASDVAARYGGEEFVVIMPNTEIAAGVMLAERIRNAIAATPVRLPNDEETAITASIGISGIRPDRDETDLKTLGDSLIARADVALYSAKSGGRNRVVAEEAS